MWRSFLLPASAADARRWMSLFLLADLALTAVILLKVPFTNIDWETYMEQVDLVLAGERDYSRVAGANGPIAYPAGFIYIFGAFRYLRMPVSTAQVVFGALYLTTTAVILEIYRLAGTPCWVMGLCLISKRVHSIFVLRLFNDGIAQLLCYVALLLFIKGRRAVAAAVFSMSVAVKMQAILCLPAVGLCLVMAGGWSVVFPLISLTAVVQLVLGAPFLATNPKAYLSLAFGGPGALQQAWSVNFKFLPAELFFHPHFTTAMLSLHVLLLAWFAHHRWTPGGLFDMRLWRWRPEPPQPTAERWVTIVFSCNFVGIACMRTMHFQYLVWYYHTLPFLAWRFVSFDHAGSRWLSKLFRMMVVVGLTLTVEACFLSTTTGKVMGPDGREWDTVGVPTIGGSALLTAVHVTLLVLMACGGSAASGQRKTV